MRRHALVSSALATCGLALACGGGSGSGGSGATAEITADNAEEIASDVMDAIFLSADLSMFGGEVPGFYPSAVGALEAGQASPLRGLAEAVRAALSRAGEPLPSLPGGVSASQVVGPITESCAVSGSSTLTGNVAGSQPTLGDRLELVFDACVELADGPELDGGFGFVITGLTGNVESLHSLVLALTFAGFGEGKQTPQHIEVDGDATTVFNTLSPPFVVTSAQGQSIRFIDSVRTLSLRDYQTLLTEDTSAGEYTLEADGRVSSSLDTYTGQVVYGTTRNLSGDDGEMPSEGVVEVLGLGDSALRIVPVAGYNVDFGTSLAPPLRSFGAESGQTGGWTNVGLADTTLTALIGGNSQARVRVDAETASGSSGIPGNDAERLRFDQFSSPAGMPWSVTIEGLAEGAYDLYLYAPTDPTVVSGAISVNGNLFGSVPAGGFAVADVSLLTGQPLVITGTDATSDSGLAGLQIVPVELDAVSLEIDADGDGEFDATQTTSWVELGF